MRTTLTIEDQLAAELKELAHHSGKSFKQIVNEALDAGLQGLKHPKGRPYHLQPATMGPARPGIDLDKALQLATEMEDAAIAHELEQRK
ncbi:DUF2191 domain-containing protein [Methylohalobius crimeensis]|uniref:DUF2191 domain-containing protein n=1 Tax=Methylohalobius crimeensis TaxID=244365 RepID=UPI0003B34AB7|nr:DUF2191 domain-containing protein [Methylohalobius crimeensis]